MSHQVTRLTPERDYIRAPFQGVERMKPQLVFLDTETTGLKPWHHEVLEVAIVGPECDPSSTDHVKSWGWSSRVMPSRLETASPKALKINGLDPKTWIDEPLPSEVALRIIQSLKGKTVVGHNVNFDLDFLRALCVEAHVVKNGSFESVFGIEGTIDTVPMVREILTPMGLQSASMDSVRGFLGWSTKGAHTAIQDALDVRRLYYLLKNVDPLDRAFIWRTVQRIKKQGKPNVTAR